MFSIVTFRTHGYIIYGGRKYAARAKIFSPHRRITTLYIECSVF